MPKRVKWRNELSLQNKNTYESKTHTGTGAAGYEAMSKLEKVLQWI